MTMSCLRGATLQGVLGVSRGLLWAQVPRCFRPQESGLCRELGLPCSCLCRVLGDAGWVMEGQPLRRLKASLLSQTRESATFEDGLALAALYTISAPPFPQTQPGACGVEGHFTENVACSFKLHETSGPQHSVIAVVRGTETIILSDMWIIFLL